MEVKQLKEIFAKEYNGCTDDILCFFAPGRINLIGEHIDYNGGLVFPAALSIGIFGMMRRRSDDIIRLRSHNAEGEIFVDLRLEIKYDKRDGWGNYPKGVIKYLKDSGFELQGQDILFFSNLPDGAGLSSSAALEVLTGYMLLYPSEQDRVDREKLAVMCQSVENNFVGVNCGIMDQFSVAMGKKDNAILLDCNSLKYKHIPFKLHDYSLVIINTNKRRGLSDSKYNERRMECEAALGEIKKHREIDNLCQADISEAEKYIKSEALLRRARHVIMENQRVHEAVYVLENRNINEFGRLMIESHMSLKNNYEVTGSELDTIVDEAIKVNGCIGVRMTGAGFGGCAIALVEDKVIDEFKARVEKGYRTKTGLIPSFYISQIGDGVKFISLP